MTKSKKSVGQKILSVSADLWKKLVLTIGNFAKSNWKGLVVVSVAVLVFFWPLITNLTSSSPGGDAMFNAWTLSRNHNCILRNGCPDYTDGNIFFPNEDSMLYSESQLSAGVLTFPLYLINNNPLFAYNVWVILSYFLAGLFMYLLAKYLSKGHEVFSILAGLVFAFSPYLLNSMSHLQSLSIFYLPLVVLLALKYFEKPNRKLLGGLFISLVLLLYASWYQAAFTMIVLAVILLGLWFYNRSSWQKIVTLGFVTLLAIICALPLALQYMRFSDQSKITYGVGEQATYSASVVDYAIPYGITPLGKIYYKINRDGQKNSFNPDSVSYHGLTLYATTLVLFAFAVIFRKKDKDWKYVNKWSSLFMGVVIVGFITSLGPLLKFKGDYSYLFNTANGVYDKVVLPLPYLIIDLIAPSLSFIRAIGRATVMVSFGLAATLALTPIAVNKIRNDKKRYLVYGLIILGLFIELFPTRSYTLSGNKYYNNMYVPKAYTFIRDNGEINNIFILAADYTYPGQKLPPEQPIRQPVFEQVLWAGYHNKNIYNGYSGYFPPGYFDKVNDFSDFDNDDVSEMKRTGIRYILLDKLLSSSSPGISSKIKAVTDNEPYEDQRYLLVKL